MQRAGGPFIAMHESPHPATETLRACYPLLVPPGPSYERDSRSNAVVSKEQERLMTAKDPAAPGFKQKAKKELKDFLIISLYLAFFFSALVTYTILLLRKYDVSTLNYTFAIINALVIAKVILIGEMMSLGKHGETRPLYQSVFYKAVIFSLFVLAFHFLEEFIKRLVHGKPFGTVWHEINPDELIGRSILVFCTFLPLFAFIELRRVLGEKKFYALFFTRGGADNPGLPTSD